MTLEQEFLNLLFINVDQTGVYNISDNLQCGKPWKGGRVSNIGWICEPFFCQSFGFHIQWNGAVCVCVGFDFAVTSPLTS